MATPSRRKVFQFFVDGPGHIPQGLEVHGRQFVQVGGLFGVVRGRRREHGGPVFHDFLHRVVAVGNRGRDAAPRVLQGHLHEHRGGVLHHLQGQFSGVHKGFGPGRIRLGSARQGHEPPVRIPGQGPQGRGRLVAPQPFRSGNAHLPAVLEDAYGHFQFDMLDPALKMAGRRGGGKGHGPGLGASQSGLDFVCEKFVQVHWISLGDSLVSIGRRKTHHSLGIGNALRRG